MRIGGEAGSSLELVSRREYSAWFGVIRYGSAVCGISVAIDFLGNFQWGDPFL